MFRWRFSLFCVVSTLCICICVGNSHMKKCAETDKQALLKLKDGFFDEMGILSSWNGEDCCKWKGISCDNLTGHVTSLNLPGYFPQGEINSSICELQHLTSLDLSNSKLNGEIPKCIGNLSHLQTLNLGSNFNLIANDLEWLSHLSHLRYLDLSNVNLSQSVDWPLSISKIPSLTELHLEGCGLHQVNTESIPHLNSSTSLKILDLRRNNLNSSTLSWVLDVFKVLERLDLSHNSLHSIPDGFANMNSLQYLDLSFSELEGSVPKSIQSLCQLKQLRLNFNNLSCQLSDCIPQLCGAQNSLESLELSDNPFSSEPLLDFSLFASLKTLSLRNTNIIGPLPQLSGHLPDLADLDLSNNQFNSGPLPDFSWHSSLTSLYLRNTNIVGPLFNVSKLFSLVVLDLSYNQLNGTLPNTVGQFSNLERLFLSSNKLNSVISEAHLSNLSRLKLLEVGQNSLSFNLSSNWVPPFRLLRLFASSCILGPKFPTWLKHQAGIGELDISNTSIADSIPTWFWELSSNFVYLNISHNKLSGALPKSLLGMESIYFYNTWDFSFNNLSGPLPPFPKLQSLFLSNNMFSGTISSFCATSSPYLTYLDLSGNFLVGPLSDCWGNFQQLKFLDLSKNNLSGKIPKSFGTLQQMRSMHLNNNNFSGEIPSLILCNNLTFIDFGDNNLHGTLPTWIGDLHQLIVLRLRANKFQGNIHESLCNLSFLQVLDLSKNNITGKIPQCLSHVVALSNLKFPRKSIFYRPYVIPAGEFAIGLFNDEVMLAWKGDDREYGKNLGFMTMIDLSCNHLTGEIPQSITILVALIGLNLSRNNLTGFIPNNIGDMKMLESLDLSRNHLYGRMPESFVKLSFLSYMNLSFNNLSGKIPLGTQLQSFDASSYEGNSGLCGPPLTNHCPDKHVTNEDDDEDEDENDLVTFGFYISLGLGFFVGFWGVCGTLVVKTSWRHSYFQFFNNMNDWLYVTLVVSLARMRRRFQVQD